MVFTASSFGENQVDFTEIFAKNHSIKLVNELKYTIYYSFSGQCVPVAWLYIMIFDLSGPPDVLYLDWPQTIIVLHAYYTQCTFISLSSLFFRFCKTLMIHGHNF